jgi:hypothetical protein
MTTQATSGTRLEALGDLVHAAMARLKIPGVVVDIANGEEER